MQAGGPSEALDAVPAAAPPSGRLSLLQIWNMCFGLLGIQIVWGLQNVNTSRIFQTLGAELDDLAILWIAGPATGLLVQPIIGHLSDRTRGRLGRRRPYILAGALCTALALFLMPNARSLWTASLMLWVLTASINIAMEPFRALVADKVPEAQRTAGFAMQVFFIGIGAVFASALPWMLVHWGGLSGQPEPGLLPQSVRTAFYIGGVCLLVAVSWTIVTTRECAPPPVLAEAARPTHMLSPARAASLVRHGIAWMAAGLAIAGAAALAGWKREIYVVAGITFLFGLLQAVVVRLRRLGRTSIGMLEIVEDIRSMPPLLKRLAVVQFFTWYGLFAMWIYTVPALALRHYGTADPTSPGYNAAADWVGVLFAGYNGVAALGALLLPRIGERLGRRATHALCLVFGAAGLFGFLLVRDPTALWLPMIGVGLAWAAILSMPYAMLAGSVPPGKAGVYMGIHNMFLVIPQLVASTMLGPLVGRVFHGQAEYALVLAAAALLIAAGFALTLPRSADTGVRP
ncbi:MFS transporter [Sphingomonas sp. KR3-1]|uniref:MFS transporter n=1 Tax=Sphingomonas sp. KR3-1 TaxID=3156611 RepID=UPI0032B55ABD